MKSKKTETRLWRISLFSILMLIAMVSCFLAGRTSQESTIKRLKNELDSVNAELFLLESESKPQFLKISPAFLKMRPNREYGSSIEQGMKASELELKERLNGSAPDSVF